MSTELDNTNEKSKLSELETQNYRQFKRLWFGQIISILGSEIVQFALIWWITIETESAFLLSLSMFLAFIPAIIIGPFAGVLVDKWDKKKLVVITDLLQALTTVMLILSFYLGFGSIWYIIGLNFLRAVFQSFHSPALMTIVSLMVPKEKLTRINGISQLFTALSQMLGPIFGALLMSVIPRIENILWVDVITFLFAIILLIKVKIPKIEPEVKDLQSEQAFKAKFKEGFQIIRNVKGLTTILFLAMLANFLLMPINTQFSLFIYRDHSGTEMDMAFVSAGMQFAIVAGAIASSAKKEWKNKVNIFLLGILFTFIGIAIIALTPYQQFWVMFVGSLIGFFGVPLLQTMLRTIIQVTIPPEAMGRVGSILRFMTSVAMPLGIILSGPIADLIGIQYLFLSAAILGIIVVGLTYAFSPIRHMNDSEFGKNITVVEPIEA
ncbi:MFS transporter [Promethearchaeum syntrophicum]|uniref:MFS transporter n=1 Tax=Promethearchaeum syntrophicum TaxID=2594042 RepID=A0A5B9D8T1_9ARCH|nr:MFS transporter [Candidatus Prometheoarchaeum syntrophicum]QEE15549.1 enterobactin exporter EntS [Candidatus Prometheoarchaeum syntrophicum]